MKQSASSRWLRLGIGAVLMVILGLIYAWSIFVNPLEQEFGWNRAQTSLTFTVCMSFFVLGLIASGFLSAKFSKRWITIFSAFCLLVGFVLCSRVSTLTGLYLSYGVFVGFGVGCANNALVSTIVKWFPDQTGVASGILMMGFGLGGMLLGPLAVQLFAILGWRGTFLLFGILFAAVLTVGSFWVVMPPEGYQVAGSAKAGGKAATAISADLGPGQVLRRPSFWLYMVWFCLVMAGGLIVIGHSASYAADLGLDQSTAALCVGALSLCNGFGRVLTGVTYDRLGLRKSMLLTTTYIVAAAALLTASSLLQSIPLMVLGFVLTGFSYGGGPTTSSTFSSEFYGMKHFSLNYAVVSSGMIPASMLGPYLAGVLRSTSEGYLSAFLVMMAMGALAFIFAAAIRKP